MKTLRIFAAMMLALMISFTSCTKSTEGPQGKSNIHGTITYKNDDGSTGTAVNPLIHVAYGKTSTTDAYDQTIVGNADGTYAVKGLAAGNYVITAEYTANRLTYTTPGYAVTLESKKGDVAVDMQLQ